MDVRLPDGTLIRNVPDGISREDFVNRLARNGYDVSKLPEPPKPTPGARQDEPNEMLSGLRDFGMGALKGASDIGATLLWPVDKARDMMDGAAQPKRSSLVTGKAPLSRNEQRRAQLDQFFQENADPESLSFKGGALTSNLAGTMGAGGALARTASAALPRLASSPVGSRLVEAIRTSGMSTGAPAASGFVGRAADLGVRSAGGAISGGVAAGMINPEEAQTGAIIGGALAPAGLAVSSTARAGWNALKGRPMSPEVISLADRAKQLGIDIPADRLVNSRPLNALASALNYVPFSGRAATEEKMASQVTQAASRLIGQDSDNMTQALRNASRDLGKKFDDVLRNNPVRFDGQLKQEIADHLQTAENELGNSALKPIKNQIKDLLEKGSSGVIDAQAAYNIKRTLDRISNHPGPEAWHALQLKKSLINALDRSLGKAEAAEFAKTREQYSNLIALEKLAINGAEGDISIARLANMKNINNAPLQEVADVASQFIKAREGQHGSMQRAAAGLGGLMLGGPASVAKGVALARGMNAGLNSSLMRNAFLGRPNPRFDNAMNALGSGFYQTLPVMGSQ